MIASSTGLANQNSLIKMTKPKGFKAVQASIAKHQGISKERAGAILASATRKAQGLAKNAKIPKKRKQ